jgi:hypothetical protein
MRTPIVLHPQSDQPPVSLSAATTTFSPTKSLHLTHPGPPKSGKGSYGSKGATPIEESESSTDEFRTINIQLIYECGTRDVGDFELARVIVENNCADQDPLQDVLHEFLVDGVNTCSHCPEAVGELFTPKFSNPNFQLDLLFELLNTDFFFDSELVKAYM